MIKARSASDSQTEMTELVLPQHANALGTVFGGQLMAWIDICGAIAAQRHCGHIAVTASVDEMNFLASIRVGDLVVLHARLNAAFNTSMEVEVIVERENRQAERTLCLDALMTFVAIDEEGKPTRIPRLLMTGEDDRRRSDEASKRREARLERRRQRQQSSS